MTISTTASRISYNGNGVTTVFSIPFRFLANGDIVVVSVSSTGVETTNILTTNYTLSGAGDDAGGSVTMLVAPAPGTRLIIYRDTEIVQDTDYISGDPFPAETHERALDRLTMICQELQDDDSRTMTLSVGTPSGISAVLPAPESLKILGWNLNADGLTNFDPLTGLPVGAGGSSHGQCRLTLDAGSLLLLPRDGNNLIIDGAVKTVPGAGVSLAATSLTVDTTYYIYAYMSGSTMTLEASTTAHSLDATTGVEIKAGSSTHTLVGMARTVTGPAWVSSVSKQFVRSWFNDSGFLSQSELASNTSYAVNDWAELTSALRIEFLAWGSEVLDFGVGGFNYHAAATGKTVGTTVGIDGVATLLPGWCVSASPTVSSGVNYMPVAFQSAYSFTEGYHYATVAVRSFDAVSFTWGGNALSTAARCAFTVKAPSSSGGGGSGGSASTQKIVACALRNTGSGWAVLDDADHTPIGVASVSVSSTAITVNYDFTAATIHTNIVTVDETFATTPTQYLVGASSGLSSMVIYMSVAGTPGVVDPTTVVSATGNLWVYGIFDET